MIKKIITVIFFVLILSTPAFAERIPVKISPNQFISTNCDEIEIGDRITFLTINDIYVNGNLYIKKNTQVFGIVDFVHPNGWLADYAQIKFKTFLTKDINNKKVTINFPLTISGNDETPNNIKQISKTVLADITRGFEISIEPSSTTYNLFINSDN